MATLPVYPAISGLVTPPSDGDSLGLFRPYDPHSEEIEEFITNHSLAQALRKNTDYNESRPHMKIPEQMRSHSLTGGTLSGPRKIVVPPLAFIEKDGKDATALFYLGGDLCGHPGIIHGGCLATILDEGLARCCFPALPNKVGMTATLSITYKAPLPADSYVCLRARTTKVEGRKAWVEGWIESLVPEGETPKVYVEAIALFIEPKQAKVSP